ncbi:MAG: isochorismatase family protein, partial [Chloroflexia bacterium]
VRKRAWSAFFGTELDLLLRRFGVDTLLIGGTQTPNCIRATVYDATVYGYRVILLADGTSSPTPDRQQANLLDLGELGVEMADCASVVEGLLAGDARPTPCPSLRPPRRQERGEFTRAVLDTVRQGDLRLDAALRMPIVSWWARRVLHDLFHRRGAPFWFELDGRPAGVLVVRRVGDALRIDALGVFPEVRRQGWGLWLLQQVEEEARRRKVNRLELQVSSGNTAALALYLRVGFRPRPRRWTELWLERRIPS